MNDCSPACSPDDPRVKRTRVAVHEATLDLLAERGWQALSIDAVARRAEVARTTIYRHWETKAQLVVDAFDAITAPPVFEPTGDTRTDLVAILGNLAAELPKARWSSVMAEMVAAAEHDEELANEKRVLGESRQRPIVEVLERAVSRGEIDGTVDPKAVLALLVGPLFYRRLMSGESIDSDLVSDVVDTVLKGLGHCCAGDEISERQ